MGVRSRCGVRPAEGTDAFRVLSGGSFRPPHPPTPSPSRGRGEDVRVEAALWVSRGINGVPAVVVEGKWLISGGQPAGVFEEALRGMAGEG